MLTGMMAVTFGVRYGAWLMAGRVQMRDEVVRALRFVPVAVLTAIVVPYVLIRDGALSVGFDNAYLVASLVAIVVSMVSKNLLLTIAVGLAAFFGWGALF